MVLLLVSNSALATDVNEITYTRLGPVYVISWRNLSYYDPAKNPRQCTRIWKEIETRKLLFRLRIECRSVEQFFKTLTGYENVLDQQLSRLDGLYRYIYGDQAPKRTVDLVFVEYQHNFRRRVFRLFVNNPPLYLVASFRELQSLLKRLSGLVMHELFHVYSFVSTNGYTGGKGKREEDLASLMGACGRIVAGESDPEKLQPFPDIYPAYLKGLTVDEAARQSIFWRDNQDVEDAEVYLNAGLGYIHSAYKLWNLVGREIHDPEKLYALCRWALQQPDDYLQTKDLSKVDLSADLAVLPDSLRKAADGQQKP